MKPRLLLDTHILVRWLASPNRLTREQSRVLRESVRMREPVGISAVTLLELAVLFRPGSQAGDVPLDELLRQLAENPAFEILPLTIDIAGEVAAIGDSLRDPADRAIVATARICKLRLVTSDQRIIESRLVACVA